MPFLLRMLNQGAMVAAPILLLFLILPITEWEVNGRQVPYAELWSSGGGAAFAASLALATAGAWGFAARIAVSRWLLVSSPLAPYMVLAIFPDSPTEPIGPAGSILTAAVFYLCLFRLRSVRTYLYPEGLGT